MLSTSRLHFHSSRSRTECKLPFSTSMPSAINLLTFKAGLKSNGHSRLVSVWIIINDGTLKSDWTSFFKRFFCKLKRSSKKKCMCLLARLTFYSWRECPFCSLICFKKGKQTFFITLLQFWWIISSAKSYWTELWFEFAIKRW